jgi:disulfide bond formation protein DsbB
LKNCGTTVSKPAESEGCVVVSTPPTITGQFLGLTTADWLTAISVGIILALILLFILKRKPKRKR